MTELWPEEPFFEELCRTRHGRLIAMATMVRGSSEGADDLVQEALIAVFRKRRQFPSVEAAEGYVRRAIVTKYIDSVRKSAKGSDAVKRYGSTVATEATTEPVIEDEATRLLATLPPRVRACIALRFLEDLSVSQTAQALGLSDGAVKRYVSDGLAALNAAMGVAPNAEPPLRSAVLPPRRTDV